LKWQFGVLGAFLAFLALLAFLPSAEATTNCRASGDWCEGYSMVGTTTGGTGSGRCFFLKTDTSTPTCTTGGIGSSSALTWELDAAGCITFYYYDIANGLVPPAVPNKVTIQVRHDDSSTSIGSSYLSNGAEPTNGQSYSFCATSTHVAGATARAGTVRLYLNAVKDNGNGLPGNTNYNVDTDGTGSQDTSHDRGALRAKMIVASINRNSYPADSTFAYGTASDESVTVTATFTEPFADNNHEHLQTGLVDEATLVVGALGSCVDIDASTTLAQSYVVDSTFPAANSPYVAALQICAGNAALTGLRWTIFAATGHCGACVRLADTSMYDSTDINIDPGIRFDKDGTGTPDDSWIVKLGSSSGAVVSVLNKGETVYLEGYLLNARGEKLTRAMMIGREDPTPTSCATPGTVTPSGGGLYSGTAVLNTGAVCNTAADATGIARYFRATNTDQNKLSAQLFAVSSLYYVDSHLQIASTLMTDDFPTEDATEILAYEVRGDGLGGDMSETTRQWCHVETVRKDTPVDTSGSAVTRTIKDPTTATRATGTTDTDSTGWTATSQNLLASTPLGDDWTALCSVAFNGNTGTDTETFESFVNVTGGGNTYQADPLKAFAAYDPTDDVVRVVISAAYLDGSARTGAEDDLFVDAYDGSMSLEVNGDNPTEIMGTAYGVYTYDFTPTGTGIYTVRVRTLDPTSMDPITVGQTLLVAPGVNGTTENATLALLLDKLGPQGEPVNIESATLDFWLPLSLWFIGLLVFLKLGKLLAAGATTAGLGLTLATGGDMGWAALALIILVLALWLEATLMEGIYQRWFGGRSGRREPN
jgi:hypothetical protein